jgi:cytochrome c-type biogenesis protein CcmH/NrfF
MRSRRLTWIPVLCALWSGRALAQPANAHTRSMPHDASGADHDTATASPPEFESRPRSPFENSLMGELRCTCGTCGLQPINTCGCEFAAKMRAEVLADLDKHDLSTETGRQLAADAVRASMVAAYGPKALHRPLNLDVPVAVAAGVLVLAIGVRTIRRRRRAA